VTGVPEGNWPAFVLKSVGHNATLTGRLKRTTRMGVVTRTERDLLKVRALRVVQPPEYRKP
jgi:hypothetical protein